MARIWEPSSNVRALLAWVEKELTAPLVSANEKAPLLWGLFINSLFSAAAADKQPQLQSEELQTPDRIQPLYVSLLSD